MRFIKRLWRTLKYWNEVDGNLLAAAVSFYASLAAFPLLMVLLAAFGFFMKFTGSGQDVQANLIQFVSLQTSDRMAEQIAGLLEQIETSAIVSGPLGFLFLLMLSIALFVNFERAFDVIWRSERPHEGILKSILWVVFYRLRAFLMLLVIAFLVVLNFASNFAIDIISETVGDFKYSKGWWRLVQTGASTLLNSLLFTMIYQTLPRATVQWKHALQGGLFAAVTWEFGRWMLAVFVISDKYNAFGVVGVFMGLLLWTFYASAVIFMGGIFVRVAKPDAQSKDAEPDAESEEAE